MSTWNLEGMTVFGNYMGEFPIRGTVSLSRVTYGGGVSHHVKLDTPINVYGAERDVVIMEHKYINRVVSSKRD
jgi:Cft2 family RNA processing exonuclease